MTGTGISGKCQKWYQVEDVRTFLISSNYIQQNHKWIDPDKFTYEIFGRPFEDYLKDGLTAIVSALNEEHGLPGTDIGFEDIEGAWGIYCKGKDRIVFDRGHLQSKDVSGIVLTSLHEWEHHRQYNLELDKPIFCDEMMHPNNDTILYPLQVHEHMAFERSSDLMDEAIRYYEQAGVKLKAHQKKSKESREEWHKEREGSLKKLEKLGYLHNDPSMSHDEKCHNAQDLIVGLSRSMDEMMVNSPWGHDDIQGWSVPADKGYRAKAYSLSEDKVIQLNVSDGHGMYCEIVADKWSEKAVCNIEAGLRKNIFRHSDDKDRLLAYSIALMKEYTTVHMHGREPIEFKIQKADLSIHADRYEKILKKAGFKKDSGRSVGYILADDIDTDIVSPEILESIRSGDRKTILPSKIEVKELEELSAEGEDEWHDRMTTPLTSSMVLSDTKSHMVKIDLSDDKRAWELHVKDKRSGAEWEFQKDGTPHCVTCFLIRSSDRGIPWKRAERTEGALRLGLQIAAGLVEKDRDISRAPSLIGVQKYSRNMDAKKYQKVLDDLGFDMSGVIGRSFLEDIDRSGLGSSIVSMIDQAMDSAPDDRGIEVMDGQGNTQGQDSFDAIEAEAGIGENFEDIEDIEYVEDIEEDAEIFFAKRLDAIRSSLGEKDDLMAAGITPALDMKAMSDER